MGSFIAYFTYEVNAGMLPLEPTIHLENDDCVEDRRPLQPLGRTREMNSDCGKQGGAHRWHSRRARYRNFLTLRSLQFVSHSLLLFAHVSYNESQTRFP